MKITFDNFFAPDTYETTKAKAIIARNKDNLLYPTYSLNENMCLDSTASTKQISDAEISELYVKHVVIGNSVLTFAREIINRTKE